MIETTLTIWHPKHPDWFADREQFCEDCCAVHIELWTPGLPTPKDLAWAVVNFVGARGVFRVTRETDTEHHGTVYTKETYEFSATTQTSPARS